MNNEKAFTLIELLIVIAIIGIMTAVSLVSLQGTKDRKAVEVAARQVAASIREAQNYSLAGKKIGSGTKIPCQFVWRTWDTTNYRIRLQQPCEIATGDDVLYLLQNGVTFKNEDGDPSSNYALFKFPVPFGNVTPVFNGTVTGLTLRKNSYCVNITVNSAGNVTESAVYTTGC